MHLQIVVPDAPVSQSLQAGISHGKNMGEELDWCNTLRQQHTDKACTDETSGVWTEKDLTKRSCGLDMHG